MKAWFTMLIKLKNNEQRKIIIIDYGSQFTQLIARKVRELGAYSEIINFSKTKN